MSSNGLDTSAFSAFRALLPSATILLSDGWVWQPSADSDGFLAHQYCQQRAVTSIPESLNVKNGEKVSVG
jgi:hypothetical protein